MFGVSHVRFLRSWSAAYDPSLLPLLASSSSEPYQPSSRLFRNAEKMRLDRRSDASGHSRPRSLLGLAWSYFVNAALVWLALEWFHESNTEAYAVGTSSATSSR